MNTINDWLDAYGESHQNLTNKKIHWICVPLIMLSLLGILSLVKLFSSPIGNFCISIAHILIFLAILFYIRLSISITVGMIIISILNLYVIHEFEVYSDNGGNTGIFLTYFIIFVAAWIGQFIGHKIEGKKPSFFDDLKFLLIGPAWLLSFIYKKIGIKY